MEGYGMLSYNNMFNEEYANNVTCPAGNAGTVNIRCKDNAIIVIENNCVKGTYPCTH